jgi:hypothetical protein
MEGAILLLLIISPIILILVIYRLFNRGKMPCVDTSNIDNHNKIFVENV